MPVTPAHAAAAWPVHRIVPQLPLSALIIGTLSPDFEYWIELGPTAREAHSLTGIVMFCLPVSLIVWVIFLYLVRPGLLRLLPAGMAATLRPPRTSVILAIVAVLVGALTHIGWDGFTHSRDWAVVQLPMLRTQVAPQLAPWLRWYRVLQHASTIAGFIAVALWIRRWIGSHPPSARRFTTEQRRRTVRALVLFCSAAALGGIVNGLRGGPAGFVYWAGLFVVGSMVGVSVALLIFGIHHRLQGTGPT